MSLYKCTRCDLVVTAGTNTYNLGLCTDQHNHTHSLHDWKFYDPNLNPVDNTGGTLGTAGINAAQAQMNTHAEVAAKEAAYLQWQAGHANAALQAKRDPSGVRFDILDPEFLLIMAKIAHYGAEHYGEYNWQKSRLTGDKGPVNHMEKHINKYKRGRPYDHLEIGDSRAIHLAAIAFNAMMEFFYECHPEVKP